MSNPVNPRNAPSGPDRSKESRNAEEIRKKWQQIQEIDETDPHGKSKKRNKQLETQMGGGSDEPVDLSPGLTPSPSPFTTSSSSAPSGVEALQRSSSVSATKTEAPSPSPTFSTESNPVPAPAYSPPPTVDSPSPSPKASPSPSPLPTSPQFYSEANVSTNEPPSSGSSSSGGYTYTPPPPVPRSAPAPAPGAGGSSESNEPEEENEAPVPVPSSAPVKKGALAEGKTPEAFPHKEGEKTLSSKKSLEKDDTKLEPSSKKISVKIKEPLEGQKELSDLPLPESMKTKASKETSHPLAAIEKETIEAAPAPALPAGTSSTQKVEEKIAPVQASQGKEAIFPPSEGQKSEEGKDDQSQQHKPGEQKIAALPLPQFDMNIQPLVQAATTQAAPYLSKETMALFQQMVGTIYIVNTKSGISTTEVLLNSPAFKDSKFFGSTITIEKYATAPNSLNIVLTGSNEAVNAFNQNLESLMAAFKNGNFSFHIGRINTALKVDKPVFHRKEKSKDSGDFKGDKER